MISLGQQKVTDEDDSTTTEDDVEHSDKQSDHEDDSDVDSVVEEDVPSEDDFDKEADIARKVLNNLITSSSAKDVSANNDSTCSEENKEPKSNETVKGADSKASKESDKVSAISKPETSSRLSKPKETEDDLQRTVFISNIPFECDTEEVKQRFSAFGVVEYFAPVLHQLTKYVL
jgi:nucleolar protein 4